MNSSVEETNEEPSEKTLKSDRKSYLSLEIALPVAVLIVSFIAFLLLNPSNVPPRTTLYFDASRYLDSTKRFYEIMQALLGGHLTQGHLESLSFYLMLDGPILPAMGMLAFFLANKFPSAADSSVLVTMQCAIQAFGSLYIFLLTRRLFKSPKVALLAALGWTTYPAAIVSCNMFLTEPLACTLSLALIHHLSYLVPDFDSKFCGLLMRKADPAENTSSQAASLDDNAESSISTMPPLAQKHKLTELANCFFAGTLWSMFALLKPAMLPASTIVFGMALVSKFISHEKNDSVKTAFAAKLIAPATAIAGALVVILPWVAFAYVTTKQITIIPSRRPVYNILQGCVLEGDGWGWYPTHPVAMMHDDAESAPAVMVSLIDADPAGFANLALRKITRFWNMPWNDYRYKILGLPFKLQALYQTLITLSGIAGLVVLMSQLATGRYKSKEIFLALSISILLLGHLIYVPFEGISRYGFTAMPFIIICAVALFRQAASGGWRRVATVFAALALCTLTFKSDPVPFLMELVHKIEIASAIQSAFRITAIALLVFVSYKASNFEKQQRDAKLMFALLASLFFLVGTFVCGAFALSMNETHIWAATLKDNWQIERSVLVDELPEPSTQGAPDWALVLVDGNENIGQAKILVNGEEIKGKLSSIYQFDAQHYDLEDWLNQFASLTRKPPDAVPRWRAIEIPLQSLKKGWNQIRLQAPVQGQGKITVYGDYEPRSSKGKIVMPFWQEVSPGKFFNDSEDRTDSRIVQRTYSETVPSKSSFLQEPYLKRGDLSNAAGLQTGEYRIFLMLGFANGFPPEHRTEALLDQHGKGDPTSKNGTQTSTMNEKPDGKPALRKSAANQKADEKKLDPKAAAARAAAREKRRTSKWKGPRMPEPNLFPLKGRELNEYAFVPVPGIADANPLSTDIDVPENVLSSSHLKVVITGETWTDQSAPAQISVSGVVTKKDAFITSILPGTPQVIDVTKNWQPFIVEGELPTEGLRNHSPLLHIEIKTSTGKAFARKLFARLVSLEKPQLKGHSVRFY